MAVQSAAWGGTVEVRSDRNHAHRTRELEVSHEEGPRTCAENGGAAHASNALRNVCIDMKGYAQVQIDKAIAT